MTDGIEDGATDGIGVGSGEGKDDGGVNEGPCVGVGVGGKAMILEYVIDDKPLDKTLLLRGVAQFESLTVMHVT